MGLMREGRTLVVEALEAVDAKRAKPLRAQYVPAAEEKEPRGEELRFSPPSPTANIAHGPTACSRQGFLSGLARET